MINPDGSLSYEVAPPPARVFKAMRTYWINPVVGTVCGLVGLAAIFVIAVQLIFAVPPSVPAIMIAVVAPLIYVGVLVWWRREAGSVAPTIMHLDEAGIRQTSADDSGVRDWADYRRWVETDQEWIAIVRGARPVMATVLPKAAVPDDEFDDVRAILHGFISPEDSPLTDSFEEE